MITGSETESRSLMMNAAIKIVEQYGFEGFTTKKWAAVCGVAEGSLYYHFKNKDDLLTQTYLMIDEEVVQLFKSVREQYDEVNSLEQVRDFLTAVWKKYYSYLLNEPAKTLFFYRFHASPRCNAEIQAIRMEHLDQSLNYLGRIGEGMNGKSDVEWNMLWTFIIETTNAYAFRVITGGRRGSEEELQQVSSLLTTGIFGFLYPERIEAQIKTE